MRHVRCQEKEKFHERNSQKASTHSTMADAKVKCRLCEKTHKVKTCKTCKETAVKGRWEITQKKQALLPLLGARPSRKGMPRKQSLKCGQLERNTSLPPIR